MINPDSKWPAYKMVVLFIVCSAAFFIFRGKLAAQGFDVGVLLAGNTLIFILGVITLMQCIKAVDDPNPHVFIRVFYAGLIARLFVCAAAAFVYIYLKRDNISKPALFTCLGLYLVYSAMEVAALRKVLRTKKNA